MKKLMALALVLLAAVPLWSCSHDDDQVVSPKDLPQAAQTFIATYFPDVTIVSVKKETEHSSAEYEAVLSNGYSIEFNATGEWIDVDAPLAQTVPSAIVPDAISTYVDANYAGVGINEISKENFGYEVELISGLDLKFSQDGSFIGTDR